MAEESLVLQGAYRSLDPAKPLEGAALASYYAQRPGIPTARLADEIKERSQPFRAVLSGQRGIGKTTELNWLKEELVKAKECVFLFDLGRAAAKNAVNGARDRLLDLRTRIFFVESVADERKVRLGFPDVLSQVSYECRLLQRAGEVDPFERKTSLAREETDRVPAESISRMQEHPSFSTLPS